MQISNKKKCTGLFHKSLIVFEFMMLIRLLPNMQMD